MAFAVGSDGNVEVKPRFAGLAGLSILAWLVFSIYPPWDPNRYYFTITMFVSGLIAAYHLRYSRTSQNPIQGGASAIFVMVWLGVFSFANGSTKVELYDYALSLKQLQFIALLPLCIIWVRPFNAEKFFGIIESEKSDQLHAAWRISVLLLILINIFNTNNEWYWKPIEFLILIPMIYETSELYKGSKDDLPVLTLFIQTELAEKFAVPISMMKSVFLIMVVFIFGILNSRLWLLVILAYFAAGMVWGVSSIIPEDLKSGEKSKEGLPVEIQDFVDSHKKSRRNKQRSKRRSKRREERRRKKSIKESIVENELEAIVIDTEKTSKIVNNNKLIVTSNTQGSELNRISLDDSIQVKALELGKRVRTGLEKPYYTLNHILSTLKEEDFSEAWKVHKKGMVFHSKRGKWNPPVGLILFPVELEKYDFRRSNEILLLGFNKPITKNTNKFDINFDTKKQKGTRITDNSIRFGDVEFNTRSLIVTKDQWNEIQEKLQLVTENDDISHTGFKTLNHMQEVLVKLSDKWLEVRLTAQEVAVNFIAGLLGSTKPVFIPREGLSAPSYPQLEDTKQRGELSHDENIKSEEL